MAQKTESQRVGKLVDVFSRLTCKLSSLQATDVTCEQGRLIRDAMKEVSLTCSVLSTMLSDDDSES